MRSILVLAVLLASSAVASLAQGTYTQIDFPGARQTFAQGIDNVGDVSGFYEDASGNIHGFLLSEGVYTTIDYPGFPDVQVFGLNNRGQIVGLGYGSGVDAAFVYDIMTQTFTGIDYPGSNGTVPYAINDSGRIAGAFYANHAKNMSGFEFDGSTYTKIVPPGSSPTLVYGLSGFGELVGFADRPGGSFNFLFERGKYYPLAIPGSLGATIFAVNDNATEFGGTYVTSSGKIAGFESRSRILKTLNTVFFPGSASTYGNGINHYGQLVGQFIDTGGLTHGFTWTPEGPAVKK